MTIRVLLVDDEHLVRTGLAMILELEDDLEVVGSVADGAAAVAATAEQRPDVVVMDVRMPGVDGIEATRQIVAEGSSGSAVLMLTTYAADEAVRDALRAGASGYVLKDAAPDELAGAIRSVAAGDAWLDPAVTRSLLLDFAQRPAPAPPPADGLPELSPREREVLRLVAHGMSNAEIAAELVVAETTVKTHLGRILTKLDLRDRAAAVATAYRRHLLHPDDLPPARPGSSRQGASRPGSPG